MSDEQGYMIGARVNPMADQSMMTAGSIIQRGSCGHDTWLSPSGIQIVADESLLLICDRCARLMMQQKKAAGEDIEVRLHPETIKEAEDELNRRRGGR